MDSKDPFGYPPSTYLWVIGLGMAAGLVRHLNKMRQFAWGHLVIDAITSAFTGLVAFWLCVAQELDGTPWMAIIIAVAGWMGSRVFVEMEAFLRQRLATTGIDPRHYVPPVPEGQEQHSSSGDNHDDQKT